MSTYQPGRRQFLRTAGVALGAAAIGASGAGIAWAQTGRSRLVRPTAESSPIGWASQAGGTTGGGSGTAVTVSSLSDLESAAGSGDAMVITVNGLFTGSGEVTVTSNKTIIGSGSGSGLVGIGLKMNGKSGANVSNVIIRNMNISKVTADSGDGDAIHIQYADHIWIDHCDLSSDLDHDEDYYDGLLDITHASDYITVSWNHLHDHNKTSLVGHSDSNGSEDTGHLRVTYHHNFWENTVQRQPRVRFGNPVHVFNNYYSSVQSYCVCSTDSGGVLVESNYFENCPDTVIDQTGSSDTGNTKAVDNYLVSSDDPVQTNPGSVASIPDSYTADTASDVKSIVTSGAGTGKI
jgi:pectate lyase